MYRNAKAIMVRGRFNLRKWNLNSQGVLKLIEKAESCTSHGLKVPFSSEDASQTFVNSSSKDEGMLKLLGVDWDNIKDELTFNFTELVESMHRLPCTKRSLLKFTASLSDPLGFLSPFVITLKMLFQTLCTDKVNWDELLPGEFQPKWDSTLYDLTLLSSSTVSSTYIAKEYIPARIL